MDNVDVDKLKYEFIRKDAVLEIVRHGELFLSEIRSLKEHLLPFFDDDMSFLYISNIPIQQSNTHQKQYFVKISRDGVEFVDKTSQQQVRTVLDFKGKKLLKNGIEQADDALLAFETKLKRVGQDIVKKRAIVLKELKGG